MGDTDGSPGLLGDAISLKLSDLIRSLGAGDRLPSERDMSESWGVSRVALRDRLQAFELLGLLERRQGAGTFVKMLDSGGLAGMLELMLASAHISHSELHVARIALERESARQAATTAERDLEGMMRAVEVFRTSRKKSEIVDADASFHNQLMRLAANPGLAFFADALQSTLFRSLQYRNQRWSAKVRSTGLLVDLHLDIVEAIAAGDSERAAAAVDRHFATFDRLVVGPSGGARVTRKP